MKVAAFITSHFGFEKECVTRATLELGGNATWLKKHKLILRNRHSETYFVMHRKIIPVDSREMIKCPREVGWQTISVGM